MKRCVIIGGAPIGNYAAARDCLREDDFNIFCDSGLRHMKQLGIRPHLIIGDFDSWEDPHMQAETITLPCEKDDTDTVYAAKEAVARGFEEALLIGAAGGRLDHTLGNVSVLLMLDKAGVKGSLVDDYSEMEIVSAQKTAVEERFGFFSLLSVAGPARGVEVKNAKYPLSEAVIDCDYPYGISNEPLSGGAEVSVGEGRLLLIKVR